VLAYDVSGTAVLQAMQLGLGDDPAAVTALLSSYARRAALVTHPKGARRYGEYVLDMKGYQIYGIYPLEPRTFCADCRGLKRRLVRVGPEWVEVPCETCKEG